jgi:hypothetical protein
MPKSVDDSILDAAIEQALAPLVGLIPPEAVDEKRRSLRLGLASHPRAQEILRRLRARPPEQRSGPVRTDGFDDAAADEGDGTGGGR